MGANCANCAPRGIVESIIALNACRYFACTTGSINECNVLSKNGMEIVFADIFGIAFTSESSGRHVDARSDPCS